MKHGRRQRGLLDNVLNSGLLALLVALAGAAAITSRSDPPPDSDSAVAAADAASQAASGSIVVELPRVVVIGHRRPADSIAIAATP